MKQPVVYAGYEWACDGQGKRPDGRHSNGSRWSQSKPIERSWWGWQHLAGDETNPADAADGDELWTGTMTNNDIDGGDEW